MAQSPSKSLQFLYDKRWPLAAACFLSILVVAYFGWARIEKFTLQLASLGDVSTGLNPTAEPKFFDTRYDIWFDADNKGLQLYNSIETKFAAEDYVLVGFEEPEEELGVFSPKCLEVIARLTAAFEKIPSVRHVRSLTSNPWIRFGVVASDPATGVAEKGLLISDLVEATPEEIAAGAISREDAVERMVAVLGARRALQLVGEEDVRAAIGAEADLDDFIGEPRLQDTIVSADGRITVIQIQVLRPRVPAATLEEAFPDDPEVRAAAPAIFISDSQYAAVRGIRHVLGMEQGLVKPTPERAELQAWIDAQPDGEQRQQLQRLFDDPRRNFMAGPDGESIRKFFEYRMQKNGRLEDRSDPANVLVAPENFVPQPRSDYQFWASGMPLFERNFMETGLEDMKLVGVMMAVISVVLMVLFRSLFATAICLVVVLGSVMGMVGVRWSMGDLLNNLTAATPNMITAVGIADAVHLCASYFYLRRFMHSKRELIVEVLRRNALPVFLTSVTTAVGFYALTVSDLFPVRSMGAWAGVGVVFAYVMTMLIVPALLSLLPLKPQEGKTEKTYEDRPHWGDVIVRNVLRFRVPVLIFSGTILAICIYGLTQLRMDSDFRTSFPDDNPVVVQLNWLEDHLGGVGDLEIVFSAPPTDDEHVADVRQQRLSELKTRQLVQAEFPEEGEPLSADERAEFERLTQQEKDYQRRRIAVSAEFLAAVNRFEARLRAESADPNSPMRIFTDFTSPLDVLRKIHQVQNENQADAYRVPDETDVPDAARREYVEYDEFADEWSYTPAQNASTLAAQYYLQYENGAKPAENLSTQISADRRDFRMQARLIQAPSETQLAAFERVRSIARDEFPSLSAQADQISAGTAWSEMELSGKSLLYAGMITSFTTGFIYSMSIALILITVLISIIFRSVFIGLISLVPNVLPIMMPIAAFGLFGWPLDGPAVFVSSIALGVCVDDTIHLFTKFTRVRNRGVDAGEALRLTYRQVGGALTVTTVVLVLGFFVLAFSQFRPNIMMGKLAVAMIGMAWIADFLVTPALLSFLPNKKPKAV